MFELLISKSALKITVIEFFEVREEKMTSRPRKT